MAETATLYDEDYYAWTRAQADALRRLASQRWNGPLDLEHLAEEVEDLGKSELSAVRSQVDRVLEHLLKLEHSPSAEPRRGWLLTVLEARGQIQDHLTATLEREVCSSLDTLYRRARRRAAIALSEHGELDVNALPANCPYTFEQIVDEDCLPTNRHGHVDRFT